MSCHSAKTTFPENVREEVLLAPVDNNNNNNNRNGNVNGNFNSDCCHDTTSTTSTTATTLQTGFRRNTGKNTHDFKLTRVVLWVFPKIRVPQNGWFTMKNLMKMDDLGENPLFSETPISKCIFVFTHFKDEKYLGKFEEFHPTLRFRSFGLTPKK